MAETVNIKVYAAPATQKGKPQSSGKTISGKSGEIADATVDKLALQSQRDIMQAEGVDTPSSPAPANGSTPNIVDDASSERGKIVTTPETEPKTVSRVAKDINKVALNELSRTVQDDIDDIIAEQASGKKTSKALRSEWEIEKDGRRGRIERQGSMLRFRESGSGHLIGEVSPKSPEGKAFLKHYGLEQEFAELAAKKGAPSSASPGATAQASSGTGRNPNRRRSKSGSGSLLSATSFTAAETGKGGARGGLSKVFRGLSNKGQYVKTIGARLLERTGITGASHLATFSEFGAAVATMQVGAYFITRSLQKDIDELKNQGRLAERMYRTRSSSEIVEDILGRAGQIAEAETARSAVRLAGEWSVLTMLMAQNIKGLARIPGLKGSFTRMGVAGGTAAAIGLAMAEFVGTPAAAQYAAQTVADHLTPAFVRGGVITLRADGGKNVTIEPNVGDIEYHRILGTVYAGSRDVDTVRNAKDKAYAFSLNIRSPFDVLRATAASMSNPKIGTGAFGQSARAALKAEADSLADAQNLSFREFLKDIGRRDDEQMAYETRRFK